MIKQKQCLKIVGQLITVDQGEIYLFTDDPEIHLEPLTALAKIKGSQRTATYGGKTIPVYSVSGFNLSKKGAKHG